MSSAHAVRSPGDDEDSWPLLESERLRELIDTGTGDGSRDAFAAVAPPTSNLERVFERVLVVRDGLRLLQQAGAAGEAVHQAQRAVDSTLRHCRRNIYALDAGAASAHTTLLRLVSEAELTVRLVDRDLSMDSCALGQIESATPKSWLARLARFLAPLTAENGDARDRYEFLVTRLLRLRGPNGFILLPRDTVQLALAYVAPVEVRTCTDQLRTSALSTLERLQGRIEATSTVEGLFADGLYAEIYGYKLSLRGAIVDPDILYSIAALNTAICERLQRQAAHSRNTEPLLRRLTESESLVRAVLGSQPRRGDLKQRFQDERRRAQLSPQQRRAALSRSLPAVGAMTARGQHPVSRRMIAAVALLATLVLAAASAPLLDAGAYTTAEVRGSQLWQLSPVLERGVVLENQLVLLGDVDAARWDRMDDSLRLHEATKLRQAMRERGLRVAVLHREGAVVCEIDARGDIQLWSARSSAEAAPD